MIPGTDTLQVFYAGSDNALWTRWPDPATTPNWSDEQSLGGVLNGDPVAAAPVVAVSPANWMTQLSDTSELSQLTLPGTHDSCTAFLVEGASCQNWDLATQLQHGIRYVDIRCRHIQDVFAIHHDSIYVRFNFGEGVRDVCVDFLKANPSECIVMQIKHEYTDADNSLTFQQVFDGTGRASKASFTRMITFRRWRRSAERSWSSGASTSRCVYPTPFTSRLPGAWTCRWSRSIGAWQLPPENWALLSPNRQPTAPDPVAGRSVTLEGLPKLGQASSAVSRA